jgi:hypothetical protein
MASRYLLRQRGFPASGQIERYHLSAARHDLDFVGPVAMVECHSMEENHGRHPLGAVIRTDHPQAISPQIDRTLVQIRSRFHGDAVAAIT